MQQPTDSNPPTHRPAAPTPCLLLSPQQVAARCCHSHQSRVRHRASCRRRYPPHVRSGGALPFPRRLGSGHRPPCVGTGRATTRVPARAARHHQSYLDRQRLDLRSANCPWDRILCPWLQQRTKGWGSVESVNVPFFLFLSCMVQCGCAAVRCAPGCGPLRCAAAVCSVCAVLCCCHCTAVLCH